MKPALGAVCAVLVLSALATAQSPTLNAMPNTVFVGADGKFETAPDIALIEFNISAQADTAKEAYDLAAKTSRGHSPGSARQRHRSQVGGNWLLRCESPVRLEESEAQSYRLPGHDQRQLEAQGFFQDRPGHPAACRRQRQCK